MGIVYNALAVSSMSLDKVDWCHSGMGSHMIHRPMSDPGVFSHQAMERDSTGIVTPSGTFHQPVPAGYMDFPKVGVMTFLDLICTVCLIVVSVCGADEQRRDIIHCVVECV